MKKIDIFIFKSFLGPFFLTFLISTFILLMQFLWRYIEDIAGKGLEYSVILEFLTYATATLIPMSMPLAVLLAALMTFGSLGENYELTALKSSGISLWRILVPLIVFSSMVSTGAFIFSNNVLPYTTLKLRTLMGDIRDKRPDIDIKPGVFYRGIKNYTIKIGEKDIESNTLRNVIIYDHSDNRGNVNVTYADSATMIIDDNQQYMIFKLYSGQSYSEIEDSKENKRKRENHYQHRRDVFESQTMIIKLEGFGLERSDENSLTKNYLMLNLSQLKYTHDSLNTKVFEARETFATSVFKKNIMKRENKNDLTRNFAELKKVDVYGKYQSLSIDEKKKAIEEALTIARAGKAYVASQAKSLNWRQRIVNRYMIEWHKKLTLSAACFIFFFIGAPLGAIIRKGGLGMPTVIAVFFFIFYYIISLTGEKMAGGSVFTPMGGMWLSSFIIFPVGVFLTYKATTDSVIFNVDAYLDPIKKAFRYNKLKAKRKYQSRKRNK